MTPAVFDKLPGELEAASSRTVRVRDAQVAVEQDSSGATAVFVTLTLSDPPDGEDTWPVEDVRELRRMVLHAINKVDPDLDLPWYVRMVPETAELYEESEEPLEVDDGA